MFYVILLTHFLEFLSCVGCPIISLNTAGLTMLVYNILYQIRTQNRENQSMATWIYLLLSGVSGRGPIAPQFDSEKMNGAGVCSVIGIVLFLIALSAFIQVLHVLTNFVTSEVINFQ